MGHTFKKLWILAYKNLFRNRRRSLFTLLIAATGFAAMALAMGYFSFSIYGLQEMTIGLGFSGEGGTGHAQIYDARLDERDEEFAMEFGLDDFENMISKLESQPEIDYVLPRIKFGGLISNGDKSLPFMGYGIKPEAEAKLRDQLTKLRDNLRLGDEVRPLDTSVYGVILGTTLAESLSASPGDYLMIYSTTVDGAVNADDVQLVSTINTGLEMVNKFYLCTHIPVVQRLINTDKISRMAIMYHNRSGLSNKVENTKSQLVSPKSSTLKLVPWNELGKFYTSIRDLFKLIFSFNGIIILAIVILSCWNIINMTTMERSREIGTLRAMGLKIKYITSVFMMESFLLGIAGVTLGFMLQLGLSYLINYLQIQMPPIPGQGSGYALQIHHVTSYHPGIALAIVFAITFSGLSSLFIIRKMTIIESLDYA